MADLASQLNEVLADEWACVRALRRAEALGEEPGPLAVINRVRKECSFHCVTLTNIIRALGGRPTDIPSARYSLKAANETFAEACDLVQSAQHHIIDELAVLIDDAALADHRSQLIKVQQLHKDNIRWLTTALGRSL